MPNPKKAVNKAMVSRMEPLNSHEKIARMLAVLAIQNVPGKVDQVVMLRSGGFSISEMAEILDIPQNTVSVRLHAAKKQKAQKGEQ